MIIKLVTYLRISLFIAFLFSATVLLAQISFDETPVERYRNFNKVDKLQQFHERFWVSLGLGYQNYQFPAASLNLSDGSTGSVVGSIPKTFTNAVSLDLGLFYRFKNNLMIGVETEDAFFDSFRRDWLSVRYDYKIFQNKNTIYFTPGLRAGRTRNKTLFKDLRSEGITIDGKNFNSETLFYYQRRVFAIGPSVMLAINSGRNVRLYISSVYHIPLASKRGVYVKENKNFFPESSFLEYTPDNSFLSSGTATNNFLNNFAVSAGIILTRN